MRLVRTLRGLAVLVLMKSHAPDAGTVQAIFARLRARQAPYERMTRIEFYKLPKTISERIRGVELQRLEVG